MDREIPGSYKVWFLWHVLKTITEQQQFSSIPRFRRLQKLKLLIHEENNSDIGTREIGEIQIDVQWRKYKKPQLG